MCNVNWVLVLEYFKVFLSWPLITLVILAIFFYRFEEPLKNLINRIVEGSILGNTFKASSTLEQQQKDGVEIEDRLAVKVAGAQNNSTQTDDLALASNLDLPNDAQTQNAINYVRDHPVETVAEYKRLFFQFTCEKLFNCIFGTQVEMLTFLEASGDVPQPLSNLVKFHLDHQKKIQRTEYQIGTFINFLVTQGMMILVNDLTNPHYKITPNGINFLSYIRATYPSTWDSRAF
jgi:hypothetical protein